MAPTTLVDVATSECSAAERNPSGVGPVARMALDDKRIRFVLVGAMNTGFGFGCFVAYQHLVGARWGYMCALALAHVTSVLFAFATHRSIVFQVSGSRLRDLWRFESVYLAGLGVNAVLLPLMVELGGLQVIVAQGVITAVNVVLSWLGHSRFSFRRPAVSS